jgi:NhaP-type Na+/H+ or K+/H+ antiporter
MTILTSGIIMSYYTKKNLSIQSRDTIHYILKSISFIFDTLIFIYLGMSLFGFNLLWDFRIIIWTFILMILGRALNIYPLSGILNQYRGDEYITFKNQIVMWFSGLRGAIA